MKLRLSFLALTAAIGLAGTLPRADGCAVVMKKEDKVTIASESALIVWDEKTKTEHFIRRANFDTKAAYFGFLVPTPTKPTLAEVPDEVFRQLEGWTAPEVKVEKKVVYRSLFGSLVTTSMMVGDAKSPERSEAGRGGPRNAVEVLDRVSVAGFDAVVLKATDSEKLRNWLEKHGYDARPQIRSWLKWYVDNDWVITAFQHRKDRAASGGLSTSAVRMTFQAETPFYPYREPEDARPEDYKGPHRLLKLFFVGSGRFEGSLGKKGGWPAQLEHSKPLTSSQAASLEKALNAGARDDSREYVPATLPQGAWLSEVQDRSTPRQGTDEVYFSRSTGQAEVARPPIIKYEVIYRTPPGEVVFLSVLGATILIGGIWMIWRFGLRKAE